MPEIIDSASVTWSEASDELSATATGRVTGVTVDDDGTIGSASDPDAITIDSSGNVGIGFSDTQGHKLRVRGPSSAANSSFDNLAVFEGPSGSNGFLLFVNDAQNASGVQTKSADDFLLNPNGGNVGIGTATPGAELEVNGDIIADGVYLGGTVAANYLDDYEEGTWTCAITDSAVGVLESRIAHYRKVGSIVTVSFYTDTNIPAATPTGTLSFAGLPFVSQDAGNRFHGVLRSRKSTGMYTVMIDANSSVGLATVESQELDATSTDIIYANGSTVERLSFSITYIAT